MLFVCMCGQCNSLRLTHKLALFNKTTNLTRHEKLDWVAKGLAERITQRKRCECKETYPLFMVVVKEFDQKGKKNNKKVVW